MTVPFLSFSLCVFLRSSPCGCLLAVGGDLDGELHTLHQCVPRPLVDRLHGLNVHAADHQTVLSELQGATDVDLLIEAEHSRADDPVRVLQERENVIQCNNSLRILNTD